MVGLATTAILSLCLLCGVDVQQPLAAAPTQDGWPNLVATRQTVFFIPFGVSDVGNPPQADPQKGDLATAVQLWVSENRGRTWRLADSVSSQRRGFLFRAEHDGIPCLKMAFDGLEQGNEDTRLEAFVHQAKQRMELVGP